MTGETVVVIRAGLPTGQRDRYGHDVLGADIERPERGALFAPASSTEPVAIGRNAVTTSTSLYFRRSVDVRAADRVRVRARVWQVDGDPAVWVRNGRTVGTVVALKSTEG